MLNSHTVGVTTDDTSSCFLGQAKCGATRSLYEGGFVAVHEQPSMSKLMGTSMEPDANFGQTKEFFDSQFRQVAESRSKFADIGFDPIVMI
jgi:hypothetical protein